MLGQSDIYHTPAWEAFRPHVLARDGDECTVGWLLGGACSGPLHVHHIQSVEDRPDLAFEIDNCATVCAYHHPKWEAIRRAVTKARPDAIPECRHHHPYPEGREACRRKRLRERGLIAA